MKRFFSWLWEVLKQLTRLHPPNPEPLSEPESEPEPEEPDIIIALPPEPEEIPEGDGEPVDTGQEPGVGGEDTWGEESTDINDVLDEEGNPRE